MTDKLDEKIDKALSRGSLYTPTREEYESANRWQRRNMTWPREILQLIRGK
jgi:hypothetical protein